MAPGTATAQRVRRRKRFSKSWRYCKRHQSSNSVLFLRAKNGCPNFRTAVFCILKTTRWASGTKEAVADEEK